MTIQFPGYWFSADLFVQQVPFVVSSLPQQTLASYTLTPTEKVNVFCTSNSTLQDAQLHTQYCYNFTPRHNGAAVCFRACSHH